MTPYYADDFVTLYHADCLEQLTWVESDVLLTDPPYGMAYKSGWSGASVANDGDESVRDEMLRVWEASEPNRPALVFGRWSVPRPAGTRQVLIWDKGNWPGMGDLSLPWGPSSEEIYVLGRGFVGSRHASVLHVPERPTGASALHPSQKPVSLLRSLLTKCPLGTVTDPFAGSGSTLIAARELGRKGIGVEIDERYCEIAARRLSQQVLDYDPLEVSRLVAVAQSRGAAS